MRKTGLTILPLVLLSVAPRAHAQADHSDRGDVADFREHEDDRPEPYAYDLEGEPEPSWSLDLGAPVLFDTNPFWAADGSRFIAGTNEGRDDLRSLSELSLAPNLALPEGVRLGLTTAQFHRFSNRDASRFTALQVGVNFGFGF